MSPIAVSETVHDQVSVPIKSKFQIDDWVKPATTTANLEWADLQEVDLRLLDSQDAQVRAKLVEQARKALVTDGFLFVTGTGVSTETLERNLAIAQYITTGLTREEKEPYAADLSGGSYRGYKLRGIWRRDGGVPDNIEHYNLESPSFEAGAKHPAKIEPLLPEIQAFADHTYHYVVYRILKLVSLALELPEDYLWDLHEQNGTIGDAAQRYMAYYPRSEEDEEKARDTWTKGHTDYNSISLLYSQPVTALQILDSTGQWKWVKHVDGAVVVNTADALDFVTGGVFKATRHRVIRPPKDQAGVIRYILIHFARFRRDLVLDPIWDSPVVKAHGRHSFQERIDAGGSAPTQDEWLRERIRRTGNELYQDDPAEASAVGKGRKVVEEVLGRKVEYFV